MPTQQMLPVITLHNFQTCGEKTLAGCVCVDLSRGNAGADNAGDLRAERVVLRLELLLPRLRALQLLHLRMGGDSRSKRTPLELRPRQLGEGRQAGKDKDK